MARHSSVMLGLSWTDLSVLGSYLDKPQRRAVTWTTPIMEIYTKDLHNLFIKRAEEKTEATVFVFNLLAWF